MNELNRRIELEALITEREGMRADNVDREVRSQTMAHGSYSFSRIAARIRALAEPESTPIAENGSDPRPYEPNEIGRPTPPYTPEDVQKLVAAARNVYGFLNARGLAMGIHNALAPFEVKR